VLTFRTPEEAVEKANNTPYGLSAGVWTEKGSRILWMAQRLRAGVVWANTFNRFDPTSPFGGYKESGYGREGGRHGGTVRTRRRPRPPGGGQAPACAGVALLDPAHPDTHSVLTALRRPPILPYGQPTSARVTNSPTLPPPNC